jgi:hypothetical protein
MRGRRRRPNKDWTADLVRHESSVLYSKSPSYPVCSKNVAVSPSVLPMIGVVKLSDTVRYRMRVEGDKRSSLLGGDALASSPARRLSSGMEDGDDCAQDC